MLNFSDNFFKKIEKKTNVGKDTILGLTKTYSSNVPSSTSWTIIIITDFISSMSGRRKTFIGIIRLGVSS